MGLKIKWNDDRVRDATHALLLIGRERLRRGQTARLIESSLAEYRRDPAAFKANKAAWAPADELGPLTNPVHVASYRNLLAAVAAFTAAAARRKRRFNSLLELDNALIAALRNVR